MPKEGLLGIDTLSRADIQAILDRTRDFQPKPNESFGRFDILKGPDHRKSVLRNVDAHAHQL